MENKYLCRHIQQERKRDMAKYVTIMDIARELGISKSTVSRALSGDTGNVKAETLQKILATAERMGYHRNELAVNFRQQSTHNIGIIIPEIVTTFYMTFINDAQAILRKQGQDKIRLPQLGLSQHEHAGVVGALRHGLFERYRRDVVRGVEGYGTRYLFRIPRDRYGLPQNRYRL